MDTSPFLYNLSFWAFAALMIGGALGVVLHRSIVYSALLLLVTFLSISAIFVLLNAPFIAAAQILVYAVGLTIVLIFGIMLTGDKPFVDPVGQERPKRFWMIPAAVSAATLGFLVWALMAPNLVANTISGLFIQQVDPATASSLAGVQAIQTDAGLSHIGQLLFSKYLIPFELASILLLLAMIGAIILSKRQFPEEEGQLTALVGESDQQDALNSPDMMQPLGVPGSSDSSQNEKEVLGVH